MTGMRFRIPDVYEKRGMTAWTVANASAGRINYNTLYRIERKGGRMAMFDADLCQALVDVLHLKSTDELFLSEPVDAPKRSRKRKAG